jgi:hypothetical protein
VSSFHRGCVFLLAYLGMKFHTLVWSFIHWYEVLYTGMKFLALVWSFIPWHEVSYTSKKFPAVARSFLPWHEVSYHLARSFIPRYDVSYYSQLRFHLMSSVWNKAGRKTCEKPTSCVNSLPEITRTCFIPRQLTYNARPPLRCHIKTWWNSSKLLQNLLFQ